MNDLNTSEFISQEYSSRVRFSLPYNNQNQNNISFKNSVHIVNNSEKKPNNHRQYLIDFIRDNNNNNRKSPLPKQMISNKNQYSLKALNNIDKDIIDKNLFFNDYFNKQKKLEIKEYNKKISNEKLIDIFEYIGEDSKRPIDIEIMNIKMHNFIPGRISSKSFGLINSYAANTNQGIDRNYNDDRVKIMINMNRPVNYMKKKPWPLISFFGIFDGHNGDHCAEFLRQNLLQYIYTNPNFPKNVEKSIKEAFILADKDYLKNFLLMKDTNNNMNDIINSNYHLDYYNNSGSCGLILLLVDTKIYIANVGDSRCLISCDNGKIQKDVTRDHKPEFPYEKKRIYDNGGNIYRNETVFKEDFQNKSLNKILLGPYRVNPGKLSVSRTIGDAKAKIKKLGGIPNVIIPEPDVYVFDYYKDNIDYFIMGCDGIFDRLKSYEVFKCADVIINKSKEILENNKFNNIFSTSYDKKINMNTTCGNIVDMILRASMLRKSYDNVTCIIVALKDLLIGNNSNEFENENKINFKKEKNEKPINKRNTKINIYDNNTENNTYNYKNYNNNYNTNINKEINRYDTENDEKNININNFTYKVISKYNNTYNNNFIYIDNKNQNQKNKSDNSNINENNNNHRRIPSQSQEKKIRELISLFSINNKKGINNENSKLLYKSYGSTNDIIREQQKLEKENDNKEMTLPNKNILILSQDNLNKKIENERMQKNKFYKKNYLEIKTNGNNKDNYSYIKRNKSITNSLNIDNNEKNNHIYNNSFKNSKNKEDNNGEEENNIYNSNKIRIKTSSINTLYQTPNKVENFGKRITTRKIVRKSNNIFNLRNNLKEKIDNNDNQENNLTLNTKYSHILPSINTSSRNENNELIKSTENLKNLKNSSININIRKNNINYYEKYKHRNLRYNSNNINDSNDNQNNIKDKSNNINTKGNKDTINKSGKFENKRIQKINLPLSSSVGLIYTKKKKIK